MNAFSLNLPQTTEVTTTYFHAKQFITILFSLFGKQLPLEEFQMLETTHRNATDFREQSLGVLRVRLSACGQQTFKPEIKFFSGFVEQQFATNAKNQLF